MRLLHAMICTMLIMAAIMLLVVVWPILCSVWFGSSMFGLFVSAVPISAAAIILVVRGL